LTGHYNFSGPLYEQVLGLLRTRIESGEWAGGAPLPGEAHLSRDFGVSVGTMRKAMDKLVQERVVVRERGRGTFVKQTSSWRANQGLRLCDDTGRPISPEISLVKSTSGAATTAEVDGLRLRPGLSMGPRVLRLSREWRSGGHLLCKEKITVEESRFPDLQDFSLRAGETLHDVYAEQYRTLIDHTNWTIKPTFSLDPEADKSEAMQSALFLRLNRTAFDMKDIPAELCEQTYACDGRLFQLTA
jgi:GntR family transcriptional regulator